MGSLIPTIIFRAWQPGYGWNGSYYYWGLTNGEWHAWRVMMYGYGLSFGVLSGFWLLAYIRKEQNLAKDLLQSHRLGYSTLLGLVPLGFHCFPCWRLPIRGRDGKKCWYGLRFLDYHCRYGGTRLVPRPKSH